MSSKAFAATSFDTVPNIYFLFCHKRYLKHFLLTGICNSIHLLLRRTLVRLVLYVAFLFPAKAPRSRDAKWKRSKGLKKFVFPFEPRRQEVTKSHKEKSFKSLLSIKRNLKLFVLKPTTNDQQPTKSSQLSSANCQLFSGAGGYFTAAIPGSSLPSKYSSMAPPPVDT